MPRYFEPISKKDLVDKIAKYNTLPGNCNHGDKEVAVLHFDWVGELGEITPQIKKDLSKVEFDFENTEYGKEHNHIRFNPITGKSEYEDEPMQIPSNKFLGLQTLDNGLTFLGVVAGGDWETPLGFIIYWDGKKLRAYIPKDGNPWNTDTKMAYGNNCEGQYENGDDSTCDEKNAVKRGWVDWDMAHIDYDKILEDIKKRILPRGN
jgi:hypothetical protein